MFDSPGDSGGRRKARLVYLSEAGAALLAGQAKLECGRLCEQQNIQVTVAASTSTGTVSGHKHYNTRSCHKREAAMRQSRIPAAAF